MDFLHRELFSIIFLLIHWEFHIMHPDHNHFPFLPYLSPTPQEIKNRKNFNLCFYMLMGTIKLSGACPFNRTESFPSLCQKSSILESYTSLSPSHFNKFSYMTSCLGCYIFWGGVEVGVVVVTEPSMFLFPSCISAIMGITVKVASLLLQSVGAQTMGFHTVSDDSTDFKYGSCL